MTIERRREPRTRITMPSFLVKRGVEEPVQMVDASFRGLFLRMHDPPPVRALVKLRIDLPSRSVAIHAVVVRLVEDADGHAGVGLRFFALNGEDKVEWEAVINAALSRAKAA